MLLWIVLPWWLLGISCHATLVRCDDSIISVNIVQVSNRICGFLCLPGSSHPIACHTSGTGVCGEVPLWDSRNSAFCLSFVFVVIFIVDSRWRVFVNQSACLSSFVRLYLSGAAGEIHQNDHKQEKRTIWPSWSRTVILIVWPAEVSETDYSTSLL